MATKFDIAWVRERNRDEPDTKRWPPLAAVSLAAVSSAFLWALIIRAAVEIF